MDIFSTLSGYGLIAVSGIDAEKFLQGQLTCDVREVTEQQSRLGAHCDTKGRVQFSFRLFKFQAVYYLRLPTSIIEHALTLLKKYAVFFKVKLESVAGWQGVGVSGQHYLSLLNQIYPLSLENNAVTIHKDIIFLSVPTMRTEIFAPQQTMLSLIKNFVASIELPSTAESWNLLDIEAGLLTVTPELAGEFTPQDINYPLINAVSFKKGCYTGQEIVARMHYLGHPKQRMYRISFSSSGQPLAGTKLYSVKDDQKQAVGVLLICAADVSQGEGIYQALAILKNVSLNLTIRLETMEEVNVLALPLEDSIT